LKDYLYLDKMRELGLDGVISSLADWYWVSDGVACQYDTIKPRSEVRILPSKRGVVGENNSMDLHASLYFTTTNTTTKPPPYDLFLAPPNSIVMSTPPALRLPRPPNISQIMCREFVRFEARPTLVDNRTDRWFAS